MMVLYFSFLRPEWTLTVKRTESVRKAITDRYAVLWKDESLPTTFSPAMLQ